MDMQAEYRDFTRRSMLVWLEAELVPPFAWGRGTAPELAAREKLAESFVNHHCNNWEMVKRAKVAEQVIEDRDTSRREASL